MIRTEAGYEPKILIVDDHLENITLLEKILEMHGFRNIISTTDSRRTVDLYRENHPDLVLLDTLMPHMDGLDVLVRLSNASKDEDLPVIILSSAGDMENRTKAVELGARDFITKPFDDTDVIVRINNILENRKLQKIINDRQDAQESEILKRTRELQDMEIELIVRLSKAAEFRYNDTGKHIMRIGQYAYQMALLLGMSEKYSEMMLYAAMMHDIGKSGIPDEVLFKPGKLNEEEWSQMKTHTVMGAQILAGSSLEVIRLAEQIALSHHEKWDGTGYPHGLKGEEIPLSGRVTALFDVFDSLLYERTYKPHWTVEQAIEEIEKGSGTHFDPYLVELFVNHQTRFLTIREELDE